jgi:hypothetical protein
VYLRLLDCSQAGFGNEIRTSTPSTRFVPKRMSKEAVSELQATSSKLLPMMPPPGVRASATVKLYAHASSAAIADPLSEYQLLASERLGELPVLRLEREIWGKRRIDSDWILRSDSLLHRVSTYTPGTRARYFLKTIATSPSRWRRGYSIDLLQDALRLDARNSTGTACDHSIARHVRFIDHT